MAKVQISLFEILKYIGDRNRPLKEGEALFKAGHIILCGLTNNLKTVKSLCLQTSALSSPPHEIEISVADEVENWKCSCSCKAGQSGYCKHIIGTLIYINRHEDLEILSCTDVTQVWGKEKKGISEMQEQSGVNDFWCHKPQKETFLTSDDVDKRNFNTLVSCQPSSSLYKFVERNEMVKDMSRCISINKQTMALSSPCNFYKIITLFYCSVPLFAALFCFSVTSPPKVDQQLLDLIENANTSQFLQNTNISVRNLKACCNIIVQELGNVDQLKIAKECSQKSDMWKQERKLRITGSRCYSVFTFSKVHEWEKKALNYFFAKDFSSKYTDHGIQYEEEALEHYKNTTHCQIITPSLIICKKFPWLAYSPDGVVVVNGKPSILLEIKCPYAGINTPSDEFINTCDYLIIANNKIELKKKHKIYGQVQLGMALLNLCQTHLIVYSPFSKSFLKVTVDFDEIFAKELIHTVSENYLQNMLHVYCKNKDKYI